MSSDMSSSLLRKIERGDFDHLLDKPMQYQAYYDYMLGEKIKRDAEGNQARSALTKVADSLLRRIEG